MGNILNRRKIYLLDGFIGFLFLGCCYAWSIFVVPLETLFNYTRTQTSLAFTICIAAFSAGGLIAGSLARKIEYHWMLKAASIMIGVGLFLTGFTHQIYQIYMTYSLISGIGIGMGYTAIISSIPLWFPEKSGTVSGVLLMGYALSTALFGTLINILISRIGVMNTFKVLGIVSFIGLMSASFLIKTPTIQELEKLPDIKKNTNTQTEELGPSQMLKKPVFYIHFLLVCTCGGAGLALINHSSPILTEELMMSSSFAAMIVSLNSIVNGLSRMGWGIVFDKIGMKKTMTLAFSSALIGGGLLFISILSKSLFFFIAGCIFMMISFGGNASLLPSIVRTLYGSLYFAINYSIYNLNALVCSIIPTIIGTVQLATGSYVTPTLIILILEGCTFGLLLLFLSTTHTSK